MKTRTRLASVALVEQFTQMGASVPLAALCLLMSVACATGPSNSPPTHHAEVATTPPGPSEPAPSAISARPHCAPRNFPERIGDAHSPWGARRLLCDAGTRPNAEGTRLTIHGFVVDTNLSRAPACVVHPRGVGDPFDCRAEIPTFWLGDRPDTPVAEAIPVMGWASTYAQLYEAIADFDSDYPSEEVVDVFWATVIPNPLPAVGAEVSVDGLYGTSFTRSSSGAVELPELGVLTYEGMRTVTPAPTLATLPTMKRRGDSTSGGALASAQVAASPGKKVRGPFAKLQGFCAGASAECLVAASDVVERLGQEEANVELGAMEPFRAVNVVARVNGSSAEYHLAMQTAKGWFVHELDLVSDDASSGEWTGSANIQSLSYESLAPGASPVVLVVTGTSGSAGEAVPPEDYFQATKTALVVCGLGKSARVSCTAPSELSEWVSDAEGALAGYAFSYRLPGGGKLQLEHFAGSPDAEASKKLGVHLIEFP